MSTTYSITRIDIASDGEAIANSVIKQNDDASHLVLLFPGLGYKASMPLLYYPSYYLASRGADVVRVTHDYRRPEMMERSEEERIETLMRNARAALEAARAMRSSYTRVTLIGKSLGTIAMAHLLHREPEGAIDDWIWMTPMLDSRRLTGAIAARPHHGLVIVGTADRFYTGEGLAEVARGTGGNEVVIEGADHSIEIEGDTLASIDALGTVMRRIIDFLRPPLPLSRG